MRILFISLIFSFLTSHSIIAQTERALVVIIANYPGHSGWSKIHSDNDLSILLPALERKGFDKKNILLLKDQQATKNNIVQALNQLARQTRKGDFIYIHFSCHGQQMENLEGGEPTDGLDEAIVSYDAQMYYSKGKYEGQNHLRDKELNKLLSNVRKKAGSTGSLLVTIDACHSTSMTRGDEEEYMRGTNSVFSSNPNFVKPPQSNRPDVPLQQTQDEAPVTVISACLSNQNNYEIKERNNFYGALSYAIYQSAFSSQYKMNSAQFAHEIMQQMRSLCKNQHPFLESTNPSISQN